MITCRTCVFRFILSIVFLAGGVLHGEELDILQMPWGITYAECLERLRRGNGQIIEEKPGQRIVYAKPGQLRLSFFGPERLARIETEVIELEGKKRVVAKTVEYSPETSPEKAILFSAELELPAVSLDDRQLIEGMEARFGRGLPTEGMVEFKDGQTLLRLYTRKFKGRHYYERLLAASLELSARRNNGIKALKAETDRLLKERLAEEQARLDDEEKKAKAKPTGLKSELIR